MAKQGNEIITGFSLETIFLTLVYDPNHYFGSGPITRYVNKQLLYGVFFFQNKKGPLTPNLLPNVDQKLGWVRSDWPKMEYNLCLP